MLTLLTGWKGFGFSAHITALLRAYSRAKLELQRSLGKGFEKIDSLGFCREIEFCPLSRNRNLSFTEIEAVENNLLIFVL